MWQGVWSSVHLKLVKNICVHGHLSMIRVLNDSRDWALTLSRQTIPQPYSWWEESKLVGIHTAVGRKISMVMSSRCVDRLKNSGCWNLNKMISYPVHQAHLTMSPCCLRLWRPSQPRCSSMLDTLLVRLQSRYKSYCSMLHRFNLYWHFILRLRNAVVLLAFFVMVPMCLFQDKVLSVVTPQVLCHVCES